jgi:hypothetical protein
MTYPWAHICHVGQVYTPVGLVLIQISATLSDMSDSLFTAPTHRNSCLFF